jgi:hypothetical protein
MNNKVDIFEVLKNVDGFNIEYYESLSPDEQKTLYPYVVMLWMGGCNSELQLLQLNAFLNMNVFELSDKHKGLLYKLACVSSDGKPKKYNYIKKKTASKKYATSCDIIRRTYNCSTQTAREYIGILDCDDIISLSNNLGEQKETIAKIKKEFK